MRDFKIKQTAQDDMKPINLKNLNERQIKTSICK